MRNSKRIKIDGREIEVLELRVRDLRALPGMVADGLSGGAQSFWASAGEILPLCTDIGLSDIEDMAPSELRQIWEAFREVNADFFEMQAKAKGVLGKTGILEDVLTALRASVKQEMSRLNAAFACSSDTATSTPQNTAIPSS